MKTATKDTIGYYERNARTFVEGTRQVDFSFFQNAFTGLLDESFPGRDRGDIRILDLGCGSGRDSACFLKAGYTVTPVDGSEAICALARAYLTVPVKCLRFDQLTGRDCYEGVFASASLLHVPGEELLEVFQKIEALLTKKGVFYLSFKYGSGERTVEGRTFTDLDEAGLESLLVHLPSMHIHSRLVTSDLRPGRESERWLNALLVKS